MKKKIALIAITTMVIFFVACKKQGAKPTPVVNGTTPLTTPDLFVGKWYVAKDSVKTLDNNSPIQNIVQPFNYSNADFVMFSKDSTATVSSLAAYSAFFTDYGSSNVDSKLFVTPPVNPVLNFKYKVSPEFTDASQTVYALSMQNANAFVSAGYNVAAITPTSLVLSNTIQIPVLEHYYVIKEYIYLKK